MTAIGLTRALQLALVGSNLALSAPVVVVDLENAIILGTVPIFCVQCTRIVSALVLNQADPCGERGSFVR